MNRSRIVYRAIQNDATSPAIFETLPFNATLLQISIRIQGAIATSEIIEILKRSGVDAAYNTIVRTYDPSITDAEFLLCPEENVEFPKGDSILVNFANTDLLTVGYELIFKEGD